MFALIPLYISSHFLMDSHLLSCFLSCILKKINIFAFMLHFNVLLAFSSFTFLEEERQLILFTLIASDSLMFFFNDQDIFF